MKQKPVAEGSAILYGGGGQDRMTKVRSDLVRGGENPPSVAVSQIGQGHLDIETEIMFDYVFDAIPKFTTHCRTLQCCRPVYF